MSSATTTQSHHDFFNSMLEMIPAAYYFASDNNDDVFDSKFMHNKDQSTKAARKAKPGKKGAKNSGSAELQAKYDPANYQTVVDIQDAAFVPQINEKKEAKKSASKESGKANTKKRKRAGGDTAKAEKEGADDKDAAAAEEEEGDGDNEDGNAGWKMNLNVPEENITMDVLRSKLQNKLDSLSNRRTDRPESDVLTQRQRKRLKMRDPKNRPERPERTESSNAKQRNKRSKGADDEADAKAAKGTTHTQEPVVKESGLDKLDFSFSNVKQDVLDGGAKKKRGKKKMTDEELLAKVEKDKQRVADLENVDAEAAKRIKMESGFEASMMRVQGVAVRDDPAMLKKAIKKREKSKEKSQKMWKERKKTVTNAIMTKQKKRVENLAARGTKAKSKAKKRALNRPGFEGGGGFLN